MALLLTENPTRFLSTIQIGITCIAITSGVYAEASLANEVHYYLASFPLLTPISKALSYFLVISFVTAISLIFGELVPKRLAMLNPELVASKLAYPMYFLFRLLNPFARILSSITDNLLKLFRAKRNNNPSITEEEIRVLMKQGANEGIFERAEQELVDNIFRLDDRKVAAVMTRRKEIDFIDLEQDPQHILQRLQDSHYSRLPACKGSIDQIVGILESKRILGAVLAKKVIDFSQYVKPPLFIPAPVTLMQLLGQLQRHNTHLALVVDEYGELEGLVTVNDVLEIIVGDLPAPDRVDDKIIQRDAHSWLMDGSVTLDEFREYFDIADAKIFLGESSGNVHTLGGAVMFKLGRIPSIADKIHWQSFAMEVVSMEKIRIGKVLVSRFDQVHEKIPS